jgi:hypothetical protein
MFDSLPVLMLQRKGIEPTAPRIHVRDKLIFYHGGRHGSCEAVRNALAKLMVESNAVSKRPGRRLDCRTVLYSTLLYSTLLYSTLH